MASFVLNTQDIYNQGTVIHSDKAVEKLEEDLLGRKGFSKQLAKNILAWKDPDSLVIGLYGKWGDGKSSVKNFITDLYKNPDKFEEDVDRDAIPKVIEFNPWIFSNQGSLIQSFLLEVGKEIGKGGDERDKEIARKLGLIRLYLGALSTISKKTELAFFRYVLPALGISGAMILDRIFAVSPIIYVFCVIGILLVEALTFSERFVSFFEKFYRQKIQLQERTLNELKEEIKNSLEHREQKILFVIDDIDRLSPEEIKSLFQLIKINLDLPNLIFLLVMDIRTVGKVISSEGIDGEEYIEKIVQFPVLIPKADDKKLSEFLFAQLNDILKFFSEDSFDKTRWSELYQSGLGKIFLKRGNLRVIKRPINQMRSSVSLISAEVDPVDFLGIRTIEYFYPELYHYISNNKDVFTTVNRHSQYDGKRLDGIRTAFESEMSKVDPYVKDVLLELFPSLKSVVENYSFGEDIQKTWRQKRRICSPDHFHTYFYLDVPKGLMKASEVGAILSTLNDVPEFKRLLEENVKEEKKIRHLLTTLLDHVSDFPSDPAKVKEILLAIFSISNPVSEIEKEVIFDFGADMELARLAYFYLKNLRDKKIPFFEAAKGAVEESDTLYGPVYFVAINDARRDGSGREIFTIPESEELAAICVKKIKKAVKDGSLKNDRNMLYILFRWKEWGEAKDIENFVKGYKKSRVALAEFVRHFKSYSLVSSGGTTEKRPRMQYGGLKEFFDLDYVKGQMDKVDMSKLTKEQKEAVELFKKDFNKKNDAMY